MISISVSEMMPPPPTPLDTVANQERGEILGERANYCTYCEEDEGNKEKRFATEYVGKRSESGLEDSRS